MDAINNFKWKVGLMSLFIIHLKLFQMNRLKAVNWLTWLLIFTFWSLWTPETLATSVFGSFAELSTVLKSICSVLALWCEWSISGCCKTLQNFHTASRIQKETISSNYRRHTCTLFQSFLEDWITNFWIVMERGPHIAVNQWMEW